MNVLIFKTDIGSKRKEEEVKPIFNNNEAIAKWTIDKEDIDNVLRIVSPGNLTEKNIMDLMKKCGFYCEILTN